MPEPDLVEEPTLDPEGVVTTEDPPPVRPLAQEPPLDQVVLPDPTPQPENYHVAIWETPETFACLRCAARGLTHAEVVYHLNAAHGEAPVPTPLAAQYTSVEAPPATGEEALARLGQVRPFPEAGGAAAAEEIVDDERPGDDGESGPGDSPGDPGRDEREPDVSP